MAVDFIAGCLGGCAGVIIGHPFDTVKVKLQTQDYRNPMYRGTWDCFAKILRTESVAGVYRGVSSPMAGVALVNAIVFGVYGNMQRNLSDPDALQTHFLAGAAAGLLQSVVASPVELVKTRVQINTQYRSTLDCLIKTYNQDGIRGVFKGLSITGVREFLGYGLYFATYEAMTRTSPGCTPAGTALMLLAGGVSGTVSWVLTYPLDVIKSRFQADIGIYSSITDCLKKSVKNEGLMFLTRGLTPTLIRAFPTNAVTFTVVTWVFRLANFGGGASEDIKKNIDSILETIPKEKLAINNYNFLEESASKIKLKLSTTGEPQKYLLRSEDLWVSDDHDEIFSEFIENSSSKHFKPIRDSDNGLEAELFDTNQTEINSFDQQIKKVNCDLNNNTIQTKEEQSKVIR